MQGRFDGQKLNQLLPRRIEWTISAENYACLESSTASADQPLWNKKTARTNHFHLRTRCFGLAGEKSGPAASANAAAEGGFGGVEGSGWLPS